MIYLYISVIGGMKLIKKDILKIKHIYLIEFILIFILLFIFSIITIKSLYMNKHNYILINGKEIDKEIKTSDIYLNPGTSSENNYILSFLKKGTYLIELNVEEQNKDIIDKYLMINVKFNEEIIYTSNLEELLNENKPISFKHTIKNIKTLNLKICYEMNINAENEIQGKSINLDINLNIKKVG